MTSASLVLGRVRTPHRGYLALAVVAVWVVLWAVLAGQQTLVLGRSDLTPLHTSLNSASEVIDNGRNSNPLFTYFINYIRLFIDAVVVFVQGLIAQPSFGRPVPVVGWLGVVALATSTALLLGNRRVALLTAAGFVSFGLLGLWEESMDTLALTLTAVALSLAVGIPLGIWAGVNDRFHALVTPVLDFMQTMPTFVYLAPLTLVFLIGPASATIATMIYAIPPAIRLTDHGIRSVSASTIEATTSLGSTRRQTLLGVQLPMAKRTIVVGVNQTIMAALSMATIAALIDAPGLGKTVIKALETLDVGASFTAGLAIVIMAIVLDRVTSAASVRVELEQRAGGADRTRHRRLLAVGALAVSLVAVWFSRTYLWAAEFPRSVVVGGREVPLDLSPQIRRTVDAAVAWIQTNLSGVTNGFRDLVSTALLNPLQALLTESPWWLTAAAVVALAYLVGGVRTAVTAGVCLLLLIGLGLWQDTMATLAAVLVAGALVMALGIVLGVWIGRSDRADQLVRPLLDAGQTMPAFVYLVPILGLFGASRFTAIIAAVIYAAPVAVKIIGDGIRAVPAATVEAATSAGSSAWQLITKVQVPMAGRAITLAANQGLIYVLAMVVVGGLVGAGALGYDVVAGFSQLELRGKGLAAGLAIVVLGIMLDRITQAGARRTAVGSGH
jgi:glycine betaine/proline transport system permease protein